MTAARVLEAYFDLVGDRFVQYRSSAFGSVLQPWNSATRRRFMTTELPELRRQRNWGYVLSDGQNRGSWLLMFHGFRPVSEPERASFLRFEFDKAFSPTVLRALATQLLEITPCTSGTGGYVFQGHPRGPLGRASWNQIFAWARRYWGVDVYDLDAVTYHTRRGLTSVSWLTLIGPSVANLDPSTMERVHEVATETVTTSGGTLVQAGTVPILGDRNQSEDLSDYETLAAVLEPFQIQGPLVFGEGYRSRWDEEMTEAWLRRFIDPETFARAY